MSDDTETITGRRFVCETHDQPGSCTPECADLLYNMSSPPVIDWYDPTGCSYPPPAQRWEYHYDPDARAVYEVTYTPNEILDDTAVGGG